jgi:hypothetical protein
MGTANYDASRVTQRKRTVTMYSWNTTNKAAVNVGQSVRREQPDTQLGEILTYRRTANAYATPTSIINGVSVNGCPCSSEFGNSSSGGTNSGNFQ